MTKAAFRKLALALPETVEHPYHQHTAFKVGKRHFATLLGNAEQVILRLAIDEQDGLVAAEPETFSLTAWGANGWTAVALPKVKPALLRQLLSRAWRAAAPKSLAASFPG